MGGSVIGLTIYDLLLYVYWLYYSFVCSLNIRDLAVCSFWHKLFLLICKIEYET
jgi:hypothetical protein